MAGRSKNLFQRFKVFQLLKLSNFLNQLQLYIKVTSRLQDSLIKTKTKRLVENVDQNLFLLDDGGQDDNHI